MTKRKSDCTPEEWAIVYAKIKQAKRNRSPQQIARDLEGARRYRASQDGEQRRLAGAIRRASRTPEERAAANRKYHLAAMRKVRERPDSVAAINYHDRIRRRSRRRYLAKASRRRQTLIYRLIQNAVPRTLPPQVRDDVVMALAESLYAGRIRQRDVAGAVQAHLRDHNREYSSFKTVSLDAVVPGTDNARLIDTIASDRVHF